MTFSEPSLKGMNSDKIGFMGIMVSALVFLSSAAWAGSRNTNGDDFPDYTRIEYAKPLPPVDQQVPAPPPGGIPLNVNMGQVSDSTSLDEIPVRLGRTSQNSDDSEPSMVGILDDSHISTTTAMAAPVASTTSVVSK